MGGRSTAAVRSLSNSVGRMAKVFNIFVEGNIASGKTSFLKYFAENHPNRAKVFAEPVEKWRNVRGHNTLDLMYQDPTRFSMTFQTYVQLTMLDMHTDVHNLKEGDVKMVERSIFSAKYCFVENLHRRSMMQDVDYAVLSEWFDWIVSKFELNADLIVYLQTRPEVVHERLVKRSRNEERKIPLDYLAALHDLHENWLIKKQFPIPGLVHIIDANDDESVMNAKYAKFAKALFESVECKEKGENDANFRCTVQN